MNLHNSARQNYARNHHYIVHVIRFFGASRSHVHRGFHGDRGKSVSEVRPQSQALVFVHIFRN